MLKACCRMEVIRRVEVDAAVRGHGHPLHRRRLAVRIILGAGAGDHGDEFVQRVRVLLVGDAGRERGGADSTLFSRKIDRSMN